jgi:hypothetical protein
MTILAMPVVQAMITATVMPLLVTPELKNFLSFLAAVPCIWPLRLATTVVMTNFLHIDAVASQQLHTSEG